MEPDSTSPATPGDAQRPTPPVDAIPASRYVVFLTITLAGLAADLATKHWIFSWLGFGRADEPDDHTWWLIKGIFGFQTNVNYGALFGFGQGHVWVFAALALVAIVGILYYLFVAGAARDGLLTVSLGSIMGGILGNLYDRLGLYDAPWKPGGRDFGVRDWILLRYEQWVWPNFNIADSLLVCGAALLVWHALRHPPQPSPRAAKLASDR